MSPASPPDSYPTAPGALLLFSEGEGVSQNNETTCNINTTTCLPWATSHLGYLLRGRVCGTSSFALCVLMWRNFIRRPTELYLFRADVDYGDGGRSWWAAAEHQRRALLMASAVASPHSSHTGSHAVRYADVILDVYRRPTF